MPVQKTGSGSLTQWILVCNCGREEEEQPEAEPINICATCGKRLEAGRSGTLTQWIFRADLCSCSNPMVIKAADSLRETRSFSMEDRGEQAQPEILEELKLEPDSFPIDRYAPLKVLGKGAAGTVYLSKDRLLNKRVAVKVLNDLCSEQLIAFQREAKATSQLNHPNIVQVLDFGISSGRSPFMVLDHIAGSSLEKLIAERGAIQLEEALVIFDQICDALSYAHDRGLFHRDLKPSNIIVIPVRAGPVGVRLIDFGVGGFKQEQIDSKDSQSKTVVGTPAYMSPDQASGNAYDARSEIYSFGCVLFEALTGRPPFIGESALATISLHAHKQPPALSDITPGAVFPEEVEALVATCLNKDQAQRFQSIEELKRAVVGVIVAVTGDDRRLTKSVVIQVRKQRRTTSTILFLGLAAVTTVTAAIVAPQFIFPDKPEAPAASAYRRKLPAAETGFEQGDSMWYPAPEGSGFGKGGWNSGPNLTDDGFKQLQNEEEVKSVCVNFNERVTGEGFKYLVDKPIAEVDLQSMAFSDTGLEELSKIKSLEFVRISLNQEITAEGLKKLLDLPKLQVLELVVMAVPEGAFDVISEMTELRSLSFYGSSGVTKEGLSKVQARLKKLEFLDLSDTKLGDDVVPIVCKMKSLNQFRGTEMNISDGSLEHFANLPVLMKLTLNSNPITDRGLYKLSKCRQLKELHISGCPGITQQGVAGLRKILPKLVLAHSSS